MTLSPKTDSAKTQPVKKSEIKYSEMETETLIVYLAANELKIERLQNQIDEICTHLGLSNGGN